MTKVDTNGNVLELGQGGVVIVAEDGREVMTVMEVSDSTVTNLFFRLRKGFKNLIASEGEADYEILSPKGKS